MPSALRQTFDANPRSCRVRERLVEVDVRDVPQRDVLAVELFVSDITGRERLTARGRARRERRPLAIVITNREHLGIVPAVRANVDRSARSEIDLTPHVALLVGFAGVREPTFASDALPATFFEPFERVVTRAIEIEVEPEVRMVRVLIVDARPQDRQPRAQAAVVVKPPQLRVLIWTCDEVCRE